MRQNWISVQTLNDVSIQRLLKEDQAESDEFLS